MRPLLISVLGLQFTLIGGFLFLDAGTMRQLGAGMMVVGFVFSLFALEAFRRDKERKLARRAAFAEERAAAEDS